MAAHPQQLIRTLPQPALSGRLRQRDRCDPAGECWREQGTPGRCAGGYALGTTPDPRGTALVLATIVAMALLLGSAIVIAVYTVVALVSRHIHRAVGEVDERVGTYQDGVETTIGRLAEALPKPGLRRIS